VSEAAARGMRTLLVLSDPGGSSSGGSGAERYCGWVDGGRGELTVGDFYSNDTVKVRRIRISSLYVCTPLGWLYTTPVRSLVCRPFLCTVMLGCDQDPSGRGIHGIVVHLHACIRDEPDCLVQTQP
jgi:hypothetical protein